VIEQGGDYTEAFTLYVTQTCIPGDSCLRFTIYDSYADGLLDGGGYKLYWNNEEVASLVGSYDGSFGESFFGYFGSFGESETVKFGCAPSETTAVPTITLTNESPPVTYAPSTSYLPSTSPPTKT